MPLLVNHFVEKFNRVMARNVSSVADEVMEVLMVHSFPGNIRELENIIEHAFVMCRDNVIHLHDLPPELQRSPRPVSPQPVHALLDDTERQVIIEALRRHNGNKGETANSLRLHRTSLWRKMKKYGLS